MDMQAKVYAIVIIWNEAIILLLIISLARGGTGNVALWNAFESVSSTHQRHLFNNSNDNI